MLSGVPSACVIHRLFVIPRFLSLSSTFSLYPRSTSMLPNDGVLLFLRPSGQDTRFTFPTHDFDHRYSKAAVIKTFSHASLGRSGPPTHRWCCRLSTTQRFRYSLHVSNSRLRRLIQQRCCYQDIFTHILLGLSGSNTHRRVRFISRTSSEALQLQCSRIAVPNIQMIRTFLEACQRLFGLMYSDEAVDATIGCWNHVYRPFSLEKNSKVMLSFVQPHHAKRSFDDGVHIA